MLSRRALGPLAAFLLLLGLLLIKCGDVFYAFVFTREFEGSWREALSQGLFNVDGWWAFTQSTPGLIMRGGGLASILGSGLCAWLATRSE
ncbi:MAG: hypothetical protein P1V35_09200 [Planctomycetota bacterium]|nr:hypothetical protein [Planctomycetota bacterium]